MESRPRILVCNNGMAASKFVRSLINGDLHVDIVMMITPSDYSANASYSRITKELEHNEADNQWRRERGSHVGLCLDTHQNSSAGRIRGTENNFIGYHEITTDGSQFRSIQAGNVFIEFAETVQGPSRMNYGNVSEIIRICQAYKCDYVWPGWGHASEDPNLPDTISQLQPKVTFIGPQASVMLDLGDKAESTLSAKAARVPTVPWSGDFDELKGGSVETVDDVIFCCRHIGYPCMIKASMGGGGKGIRTVWGFHSNTQNNDHLQILRNLEEKFRNEPTQSTDDSHQFDVKSKSRFDEEVKALERKEITDAFDEVKLEIPKGSYLVMKCITRARHFEVQIIADLHGNVASLGTRDCSLQRRNQKMVEEGPVTLIHPLEVLRMEEAAKSLCRYVNYQSAGTVEFIYDMDFIDTSENGSNEQMKGGYYFLEVNTRLQVEHPVTEMLTDINLPVAMVKISMGIPLMDIPDVSRFIRQDTNDIILDHRLLSEKGLNVILPRTNRFKRRHVMASRITAESPEEGFRPSSGLLRRVALFDGFQCNMEQNDDDWGDAPVNEGENTQIYGGPYFCYFSVFADGVESAEITTFSDSQFGHSFVIGTDRDDAISRVARMLRRIEVIGDVVSSIDFMMHVIRADAFKNNYFHCNWLLSPDGGLKSVTDRTGVYLTSPSSPPNLPHLEDSTLDELHGISTAPSMLNIKEMYHTKLILDTFIAAGIAKYKSISDTREDVFRIKLKAKQLPPDLCLSVSSTIVFKKNLYIPTACLKAHVNVFAISHDIVDVTVNGKVFRGIRIENLNSFSVNTQCNTMTQEIRIHYPVDSYVYGTNVSEVECYQVQSGPSITSRTTRLVVHKGPDADSLRLYMGGSRSQFWDIIKEEDVSVVSSSSGGKVESINVINGTRLERGDEICKMESMKMIFPIIMKVSAVVNFVVNPGTVLKPNDCIANLTEIRLPDSLSMSDFEAEMFEFDHIFRMIEIPDLDANGIYSTVLSIEEIIYVIQGYHIPRSITIKSFVEEVIVFVFSKDTTGENSDGITSDLLSPDSVPRNVLQIIDLILRLEVPLDRVHSEKLQFLSQPSDSRLALSLYKHASESDLFRDCNRTLSYISNSYHQQTDDNEDSTVLILLRARRNHDLRVYLLTRILEVWIRSGFDIRVEESRYKEGRRLLHLAGNLKTKPYLTVRILAIYIIIQSSPVERLFRHRNLSSGKSNKKVITRVDERSELAVSDIMELEFLTDIPEKVRSRGKRVTTRTLLGGHLESLSLFPPQERKPLESGSLQNGAEIITSSDLPNELISSLTNITRNNKNERRLQSVEGNHPKTGSLCPKDLANTKQKKEISHNNEPILVINVCDDSHIIDCMVDTLHEIAFEQRTPDFPQEGVGRKQNTIPKTQHSIPSLVDQNRKVKMILGVSWERRSERTIFPDITAATLQRDILLQVVDGIITTRDLSKIDLLSVWYICYADSSISSPSSLRKRTFEISHYPLKIKELLFYENLPVVLWDTLELFRLDAYRYSLISEDTSGPKQKYDSLTCSCFSYPSVDPSDANNAISLFSLVDYCTVIKVEALLNPFSSPSVLSVDFSNGSLDTNGRSDNRESKEEVKCSPKKFYFDPPVVGFREPIQSILLVKVIKVVRERTSLSDCLVPSFLAGMVKLIPPSGKTKSSKLSTDQLHVTIFFDVNESKLQLQNHLDERGVCTILEYCEDAAIRACAAISPSIWSYVYGIEVHVVFNEYLSNYSPLRIYISNPTLQDVKCKAVFESRDIYTRECVGFGIESFYAPRSHRVITDSEDSTHNSQEGDSTCRRGQLDIKRDSRMFTTAPFQMPTDLTLKRHMSLNQQTCYIRDFPSLFEEAVEADWASGAMGLGVIESLRHNISGLPKVEVVELRLVSKNTAERDPWRSHDPSLMLIEFDSRGTRIRDYSPVTNDDVGCGTSLLHGVTDIAMVAWRMRIVTRACPKGRIVYVIGNDITMNHGSFGPLEDELFYYVSKLARMEKKPRLYISANSGANLGMSKEVFDKFRVQWKGNNNGEVDYLYLDLESYEELKDYVIAEEIFGEIGGVVEKRMKLTTIIGKEHGIGVECLSGSGLIAGESSLAYSEGGATITFVTGRSVGIGAYLARLSQRVIQRDSAPLLLTGFGVLNSVIGKEVYTCNDEIGGPGVMHLNGISQLVVSSDLEGVQMIIKYLSYIPDTQNHVSLCQLTSIVESPSTPPECIYGNRRIMYHERGRDVADSKSFSNPSIYTTDGVNDTINPSLSVEDGLITSPTGKLPYDEDSFFELMAGWAPAVRTGRCRILGRPYGLIIDLNESDISFRIPPDPADENEAERVQVFTKGILYAESLDKMTQTVNDCRGEGVPVVIYSNAMILDHSDLEVTQSLAEFAKAIINLGTPVIFLQADITCPYLKETVLHSAKTCHILPATDEAIRFLIDDCIVDCYEAEKKLELNADSREEILKEIMTYCDESEELRDLVLRTIEDLHPGEFLVHGIKQK